MAQQQEIQKAIGAHGMWKVRLQATIDSGKTEMPIETIRVDNQCEFGKWLYGAGLTVQEKSSPHYAKVKELHSLFHKAAARVAALAVSGKEAEAQKMINTGGTYAETSAKLTGAMMEWYTCLK